MYNSGQDLVFWVWRSYGKKIESAGSITDKKEYSDFLSQLIDEAAGGLANLAGGDKQKWLELARVAIMAKLDELGIAQPIKDNVIEVKFGEKET